MSAATARISGIVERHLGHGADDELFAKGMALCDGFPPDCSFHHTCLQDGDCFKRRPHIEAARAMEAEARKREGAVRAYFLKAAQAIRCGEIYIGATVTSIDRL